MMAKARPAVLALVALLVLTTAACSGKKGNEGSGPASPDAKTELTAAIGALKDKPYKFVVAQGDEEIGSGATDGSTGTQYHATVSDPSSGASVQLDAVRVNKTAYLRVDFGALAGMVPVLGDLNRKWVKVDPKKLPASFAKQLDAGLNADLSELSAAITTAQRTGDTYTGTLDLSKAAGLLDPTSLAKVSATTGTVPFEATVAGGVLSKLTVKGVEMANKPTDVTITISDVGTPITIEQPKGAVDAPADLYALLGKA